MFPFLQFLSSDVRQMFYDFWENIRTGRMSQSQADAMLAKAEADARKNGVSESAIAKMKKDMLSVIKLNGGTSETVATVRVPGLLNDANTSDEKKILRWVLIGVAVLVVLVVVIKVAK
jgi:hypothetical protein